MQYFQGLLGARSDTDPRRTRHQQQTQKRLPAIQTQQQYRSNQPATRKHRSQCGRRNIAFVSRTLRPGRGDRGSGSPGKCTDGRCGHGGCQSIDAAALVVFLWAIAVRSAADPIWGGSESVGSGYGFTVADGRSWRSPRGGAVFAATRRRCTSLGYCKYYIRI